MYMHLMVKSLEVVDKHESSNNTESAPEFGRWKSTNL